jgi:hypothetical protein
MVGTSKSWGRNQRDQCQLKVVVAIAGVETVQWQSNGEHCVGGDRSGGNSDSEGDRKTGANAQAMPRCGSEKY